MLSQSSRTPEVYQTAGCQQIEVVVLMRTFGRESPTFPCTALQPRPPRLELFGFQKRPARGGWPFLYKGTTGGTELNNSDGVSIQIGPMKQGHNSKLGNKSLYIDKKSNPFPVFANKLLHFSNLAPRYRIVISLSRTFFPPLSPPPKPLVLPCWRFRLRFDPTRGPRQNLVPILVQEDLGVDDSQWRQVWVSDGSKRLDCWFLCVLVFVGFLRD